MGNTVKTSGKLTEETRRVIRGMLARGDRIQDVAYFFAVSPATVHAIKKKGGGRGFEELPPPGPYQLVAKEGLAVIERKAAAYDEAQAKLAAQNELINELEQLLERHRSRRDELATYSVHRNKTEPLSMVN